MIRFDNLTTGQVHEYARLLAAEAALATGASEVGLMILVGTIKVTGRRTTGSWQEQLSRPVDEDRLGGFLSGVFARSFDEFAVGGRLPLADQGDEVARVDGAPAVMLWGGRCPGPTHSRPERAQGSGLPRQNFRLSPWLVGLAGESLSSFGACHRKRISMPSGTPRACGRTHVSSRRRMIPTWRARSRASALAVWPSVRCRRWPGTSEPL